MTTYKLRATLQKVKPSVTRTFSVPSDISFLDLHLIIQAMAGWGGNCSHFFRVAGKKIGAKNFGVSEEADEMLEAYGEGKIVYEYGPYAVDLMFLKGKIDETDVPVILDSSEEFPPEECKTLDEYLEVLQILDDSDDPSHEDMVQWMKSVADSQNIDEVNKDFSEHWERIGRINGRIPFNVAATIGALMITGCEGFFYDVDTSNLVEETDGSDRFIPVDVNEPFLDILAGMYADMISLKADNLREILLEDEYRQGWEEYAENFLDEIVDHWADAHGYIVESYVDSDISKLLDSLEGN